MYCEQFAKVSGMADLSVVSEFSHGLLLTCDNNNVTSVDRISCRLVEFVNSAPVIGTHDKSMDFVSNLVERVVANEHFGAFVPQQRVSATPLTV